MVFDEELGIAYESYIAEIMRLFLILSRYSDLDLTVYDSPEGRYALYDLLSTYGILKELTDFVEEDMRIVDCMAFRMQNAARRKFEYEQSLIYKLNRSLGDLLGAENLMESIAKAEGLNEKLIEMLGMAQEKKATEFGGLKLAKKQDTH